MLDDFPSNQQLEMLREDATNGLIEQMNPSLHLVSEVESTHLGSNNSSNNTTSTSNNSTSSSSNSDQQTEHLQTNNNLHHLEQFERHHQQHQQQQHQHQQEQRQSHYFAFEPNSNYNNNNKFNSIDASSSTSSPNNSILNVKSEIQSPSNIGNMNVDTSQHNNMIPTAHGSEHQIHYSLPTTKNLSDSSPSSMALNFSHDLLQQTGHHNQTGGMHQHSDGGDVKPHLSNSFDIDSGSLMQSAAVGMNMWKNTMGLNHAFKHPVIVDHNFLPNSDLNSFSNWAHGNNLGHQSASMTHHILDSQQLVGYSQHQRALPIPNQDLMGASMKGQSPAEQASFMLNSINHQASTSQNSSSSHQTTQPLDNLNLRSHSLDHSASYNLSINDNQFYNSSRSESRSHPNTVKSSFMATDRSVHMSLNNHQGQQSYHNNNEHSNNPQPTTSHHVSGSNSGNSSSKNVGNFRCSTCNEVFPLRTAYQSHLKTHSQDKGSKAKFQCELCGHSFSQKTSLNRHMKSHTGERPFPCEICAKAFSEKERLKIHMRTHTGEKPFSCSICGKSFSQKSTVKRHQTVHTGEKKFRCDCGKGFANRGNLIAHIKTRGSNHFE